MKVQFYARMAILLFLVLFISINSSFAQDIERLKRGVVKIEATTFEEKRKMSTPTVEKGIFKILIPLGFISKAITETMTTTTICFRFPCTIDVFSPDTSKS